MRLDSHQHFWQYTPSAYGWIDDSMRSIQRDFLPADLAPLLCSERLDGAVAIQARQSVEETRWLLNLADQSPDVVRAVVGWAPISSPTFSRSLEELAHPALRGLRHVVQAEPPGFLLSSEFNLGIRSLSQTGLVYELLLYPGQLKEAIEFVDAHSSQSFVLDHLGKPFIAKAEMEPWATDIRDLAQRPNVACKVSGMVTEADWQTWSPSSLRPYFETVLDAFGPGRIMAGSDWPVLSVASSYPRWWQVVRDWVAPLSVSEQNDILGGTAARAYRISAPTPTPLPPRGSWGPQ